MSKLAVFLVLSAIVCVSHAVVFTDCGSEAGTVNSIQVSGCTDDDDRCPFVHKTNVNVTINFTASVASAAPTIEIAGKKGPFWISWALDPDSACEWNVKCPIVSGDANDLKISVLISPKYPNINVIVRVKVVDGDSVLLCQQFPVTIQD